MKILVACEESQAVTKAFRAKGHEAYSCDIMECSGGHPEWHLQQDVTELLAQEWDMIIAFPPCTDLAVSGAAWFEQKRKDGRQQASIEFFMKFANCDCPKIAIENPVGIMSTHYRKPDQIIQPWQYGHETTKATCLWLKGLPKLTPSNVVSKGERQYYPSGNSSPMWHAKTGSGCSVIRSKTFQGIADAMAEQWGSDSTTARQLDMFESVIKP